MSYHDFLATTWQTNWVYMLNLRSISLLSPWQPVVIWSSMVEPSIKPDTSLVCVFFQFPFFFLQLVGPVLRRWICQVLSSSQPGLSSSVSALVLYFVSPVTLCFQISSLPTAQIITAPLGEAVCSCISRGIIRGGVSVLKKTKTKALTDRRHLEAAPTTKLTDGKPETLSLSKTIGVMAFFKNNPSSQVILLSDSCHIHAFVAC